MGQKKGKWARREGLGWLGKGKRAGGRFSGPRKKNRKRERGIWAEEKKEKVLHFFK